MKKGTVSLSNRFWQGHPDVALFNGKLYVVFRRSDSHLPTAITKIILTSHEIDYDDKYVDWEKSKQISTGSHFGVKFNCPRLSVINDVLYIICDTVPSDEQFIDAENGPDTRIWIWKSLDGEKWEGPIRTNIQGIVPDRILQASEDSFLISTHTHKLFSSNSELKNPVTSLGKGDIYEYIETKGRLVQNVWQSNDIGKDWVGPVPLAHSINNNFCEASLCKVGFVIIAIMRENSRRGEPAYRCVSGNGGMSWSKPTRSRLFGCHRPVTGLLHSGRLLTTYREQCNSVKKTYWAKNTFAALTDPESITEGKDALVHSVILPLDHDRSRQSDGGYTGWVQLPDNSIFIVNYITDDRFFPYIRWYKINEQDF